ncbi:MAG: hypothetical protein KC621_02120 [Myxococcales bacterium]|nr:hypothetical protein [Myxococcales bacterium]
MKRFRLDIVGKLEDHPRLLRAYGRVKGGEVALVLRPLDYTGLLVRIGKDEAHQWVPTGDNVPVEWPRVRARVKVSPLGTRAIVLDGPLAMKGFRLKAEAGEGDVLSVAVDVENKVAVSVIGDAPRRPEAPVDGADAVRAIKRLQTGLPKPGAVTFRGQWAGTLVCDDGHPRLELRRKLASYGWLRIESGRDGWTWRFERLAKWFGEADTLVGETYATLLQAIDAGVLGALGLVQVACRVRDTRRRQALDAEWAQTHPLPAPRSTRNPTERLQEPTEPSPKSSAAPKAHSAPKSPRKTTQKRSTRKTAPRTRKTGSPTRKAAARTRKATAAKPAPGRSKRDPPSAPAPQPQLEASPTQPEDADLIAAFSAALATALDT